jgi:catechol 2,3-dioxygenase-like lactoylglutathione lyase family enzyme
MMTGLIEVDKLHSIGVIVRDLEVATLRYAEIFGIDEWDVREFGADRLSHSSSYGRATQPTFRSATATTVPPTHNIEHVGDRLAPVTFELVQPLCGESPFQEFRFRRGQGISHLTLSTLGVDDFAALRDTLAEKGIAVAASTTVDGRLQRHFLDTRNALGGFLIEVLVSLDEADGHLDVTERWNHAGRYQRPDGVGPLALQYVDHFGVVVHDVMATIERYHNLLGIPTWMMRDWRTEPGLLENAYYRDEPVQHEYFTALSGPFRDFGWEIIEPTIGPSHYNREFRDRWGQGIHHMLVNVSLDKADWLLTQKWLSSIDVPLVMGADMLGGSAGFCYYDTSAALGGYILETLLLPQTPIDPSQAMPDFMVDFAAVTSTIGGR